MTGAPAGPGWPRLRVAVAALTVVLVAGAVFMLRGAEEGLIAGQAPGPLDTYVAALQANDVEAAMAVVSKDVVDGFTPWLIASDTSGTEVTNCRVINETTGQIACDVDMGPDFFYTLIGGESETVLYVDPVDGRLDLVRFPEPDDWSAMRQFGTWMKEFHADQYPLLFDSSGGTIWSGEAGRLQFEFLDEYLDYLASQG